MSHPGIVLKVETPAGHLVFLDSDRLHYLVKLGGIAAGDWYELFPGEGCWFTGSDLKIFIKPVMLPDDYPDDEPEEDPEPFLTISHDAPFNAFRPVEDFETDLRDAEYMISVSYSLNGKPCTAQDIRDHFAALDDFEADLREGIS